jgi:hypoxanthine phosphoribosyltransferase
VDLSALGNDIERVVVSEEQIQNRLKELAAQVNKDYEGRDLILVGVLKGAIMAMADFSRHLQRHVDMDWMAVSSYGAGTKSSGVVRILKDLDSDILDTGLTLSWLTENLLSRGAKSVSVLTVLRKPDAATVKVEAKYVGFDIPSEFVVGYGLDFNQKYRNLPFIGVLAKHLYS